MMKMLIRILTLAAAFGFSIARADLSDSSLVPQEEMNFAKGYLTKLREKDYDYIRSHLESRLNEQVTDEKLDEIVNYFPSGEPLSTELIGSQVNASDDLWQGNFSFEYHFESGWALANVVIQRVGDDAKVVGMNVYRTKGPQKELNKFTLSEKSALHYVVLVMACVVPLFILTTLVFCVRTPIRKKKWLWVIFILLSVGAISINWTTGAHRIQLIYFQLLGAGFVSSAWGGAWTITAGFPLGAVLFWLKRKKLIEQSKEADLDKQADGETRPPLQTP